MALPRQMNGAAPRKGSFRTPVWSCCCSDDMPAPAAVSFAKQCRCVGKTHSFLQQPPASAAKAQAPGTRSFTVSGPRQQEIARFLTHPRKPAILAMSRPDAKKNITTLVKAFGQNPMLRQISNLVLVMVRCSLPLGPCPLPERFWLLHMCTMCSSGVQPKPQSTGCGRPMRPPPFRTQLCL